MARIDLAANVEPVRPLNFSVDGRVLRGSWTRRVGVTWNLETRQLLPASDAGWLAADSRTDEIGTRNRAVLPFDQMGRLRSLTIPWQRFRDRADVGGLTNVDLSNDGRLLAVGSETGFLAIFDYANLANFSILAGSMQDVDGVAFSPDSRRLATSSHGDEMVKLWDMETRQELLTLPGTGSEIYAIEFTDNGNTILAGRAACFGRDISGLCQFWTAPSWGEIAAAESSRGR
jgi:WD40 repeat protein